MSTIDANRRRNQIIAERYMAKVERELQLDQEPDHRLWEMVEDSLQASRRLRQLLGHSKQGSEVVKAQWALRELEKRGTQLQLPM